MQIIKTKEELLALDTELLLRAIQEFPTEKYDLKVFYRLIITTNKSNYFWFKVYQYVEDTEINIDYDWMITLTMIYK
mgnify:CR=1 FL=1